MLRRLTNSGLNLVVLVSAIVVFVGAFLALNTLAAAQKPPTTTVLAASRDLSIGDVLDVEDIVETTIYVDERASIYIPTAEAPEVIGSVVAQPIFAGQPLNRAAVIASAGENTRLSAVLAQFPDHSLFPLPLEAANVVAPQVGAFLPGDLVGVTVVIGTRPQFPATPTPQPNVFTIPNEIIQGLPTVIPDMNDLVYTTTLDIPFVDDETEEQKALDRAAPPLAKDLFPQGARVIAVQGLPDNPTTVGADGVTDGPPVFNELPEKKLLVLLIPNESREHLALAMQRADQVFVSLIVQSAEDGLTSGFTYWDFEDLFKSDREKVLGDLSDTIPSAADPTMSIPTPTPAP